MRAFIILATIALAHGAKLERTYLPPSHARTSGGSGNFLQTPVSGPSSQSQSGNGFVQTGAGFSQTGNGFSQTGAEFSRNGNGFSQTGAEFSRNGNSLSQNGVEFPQAHSERNNGFNNFGIESRPERAQAALERNAAILRQENSNDGETFAYAFETENGIYAEESGVATNGVEAQGEYSYTGDDGQVYSIRYTADQNGFVAQGDHIPTAPPVPEEILKALEQNARDEAAGIFDDGTYNEGKYADSNAYNGQQNGQQNYQQNYQQYNNGNDEDTVVTNAAFARNYPSDADVSRGTSATSSTGSVNGVEKAYLPPFAAQAAASIRGSASAVGGRTGATFGARGPASSGVEKAYLPPLATQAGNGFGRRQQAFDSKNGYRY